MAADYDAVLTAIREVLEDDAGTLRTLGTRFFGGLFGDIDDDEASLRAMERPIVEATITGRRRHPSSPSRMGSYKLEEIDVTVRVIRHLNADHALDDDRRDDVKALAINDGDLIAQALTYPGNLTQTAAAAPTNLCTGCLSETEEGTTVARVKLTDTGRLIETEHVFVGVVQATQATS